ncbi:hypothetical protein Fmac_028416 [Flemingia macrophylla]|uniref:Late embryogenesis abundant protein LEA-2 subgroup domain-containing protein n=1 Tax=Flemingia macrophylla TaxID=520843 RepID=A0ABD1L7F6_9FABA
MKSNPNKVGFKYSSSMAFLKYRGEVIGEVPFPDGKISSSETKQYNLNLTLLADRLFFNSQLYSDVISGTLPLNTFVRISVKVSIIGIKIHVVSSTSCDVAVQLSSKTINQNCHSKRKL